MSGTSDARLSLNTLAPMAQPTPHAQLPPVVLFDDGLGLLSPLTDLRPSFDIRTGALTLRERLGPRIEAWHCPVHLQPLVRERMSMTALEDLRTDGPLLFLNGRCPIPPREAF